MIKTYYLINILYFHLITLFNEKNTTSFFNFSFFSCAEDDVDIMKLQSVYSEIEITNYQNISFVFSSGGASISLTCSDNNFNHTTNTYQVSVIENTSFLHCMHVHNPPFNLTSFVDVVTKVYHKNSLRETRTYSFGYLASCSYKSIGDSYSKIAN